MYTKVKVNDFTQPKPYYIRYKQLRPKTEVEEKEWFASHVMLPFAVIAIALVLVMPAFDTLF
jgi:hypothetical protein